MSEYLTFDPNTEFKLIGDAFEMDEIVQRDALIRFYTLDEQIADAFDKMVPTEGGTKFEIEKLVKKTERLRELYQTYVVPTADGYEVHTPELRRLFPWVLPVYATGDRVPADLVSTIGPLLSPESRQNANGFERLLTAFPHPYAATGDGFPYTPTRPLEFVNVNGKDPIRALPEIELTQSRQHENGTTVISTRYIEGTSDTIKCLGYYLTARDVEIPNPIPDHPFFADKSARFYPSTQPAHEIVPDVKSVLEHGVPVTTDPYGEGMNFLRVYDITLSDIPWSSWSSRFPNVQRVDGPPPAEPIANMKDTQYKPDKKLLTEYGTEYYPGLSARHWLLNQIDGGALVIVMLQSNVSGAGVMHLERVVEPIQSLPQVPLAQCGLDGLSFQDFLVQGTTRQFDVSRNGKWIGNEYKCIPLDIVNQERKQVGHKNRIQWKDGTQNEILTRYKQALLQHKRPQPNVKSFAGSKIPVKAESQTRLKVIAILGDPSRLDVDKKQALEKLLTVSKALHSKQVWTDADGMFLLCDHTLGILKGDLEKDSDQFYRTWTSLIEGARACKVCGEVVDHTILVNQAGYSDTGRVIVHAEALNSPVFSGHHLATFVTSLRALSPLFDMKDPSDSTLFLILSLLQVLPEQVQLLPVLHFGRELSSAIGKKGNSDAVQSARGVVGIACAITLLQSHVPQLVPRRTFGPRPLILSGFPRDTNDATKFPIAESVFTVFRKTFQAYPTALQGPSVQVMRSILNSAKEVTSNLNVFIKRFAEKFKDQLSTAKIEFEKIPPVPEPVRLLTMILPPPPGDPVRFPVCPSTRLSWISTAQPVLGHAQVSMKKLVVSSGAIPSRHVQIEVPQIERISDAKIRELIGLKPSKKMVITNSWTSNFTILQRLASAIRRNDLVPLIDTSAYSDAILGNIMDGLLKKLYIEIEKSDTFMRKYDELMRSDSTLFALTKKIDDAKKESNNLRAKERHKFTDILRNQTDPDRQITKELIDLGLAPYLITNADRDRFAQQLEDELRLDANEVIENEPEIGVGQPRTGDGEEEDAPDDGQYGSNAAAGNREQDDQQGPVDTEDSI